MKCDEIEKKIIEIMNQVGMCVDDSIDFEHEDLVVNEYFHDSFQFISFIMDLEEYFGIALPDSYVGLEHFTSLKALACSIQDLLEEKID